MATRRSTRVKQQPPAPRLDLTDDEDSERAAGEDDAFVQSGGVEEDLEQMSEVEEDEEYEDKPKARKKAKVKKEDKDKGALEIFVNMPADILAEICSHLQPLDLLHLARVNHPFRNFLQSPNAVALWSNARRAVGLPELTVPFRTEEQYASLMWEKWCMTCDREEGRWNPTVDYVLRKRCCGNCSRSHFVTVSAFKTPPALTSTLVAKAVTPSGTLYSTCFKADALAIIERLKVLSKDRFASMLTGKKGDVTIESFIKQREEFHALLKQDGAKLQDWVNEHARQEEAKAEAIREGKCEKRRADIEEKLQADGWDPIDFDDEDFAFDDEVYKTKKLTKKEWEKIQDHVVAVLTTIREERLEREAEEREEERKEQLEGYHQRHRAAQATDINRAIFPILEEFLRLDSVMPLWQEDVELDDARFAAASPAIDREIESLRPAIIDTLYRRARNARIYARDLLSGNSAILDVVSDAAEPAPWDDELTPAVQNCVLRLIGSVLYCQGCSNSGSYPGLVGHACSRDLYQWGDTYSLAEPLTVKTAWVGMMWSILAVMGRKEEEVQSLDELEKVGKRFVCGSCLAEQVQGGQVASYGWKSMIEHAAGLHRRISEVKLLGVGDSYLTNDQGVRVRVRV